MTKETTPSESLVFGEATEADVHDVVALVESAYRGPSSREGWTTEADLLEGQRVDHSMVRDLLGRPDAFVLTARLAGALVSCCELQRRTADDGVYLGMFAVRPELQGGGTGRRVLAEAETRALSRWGPTRMMLSVIDVRHELVAWYERRGYALTGETRAFPYGDARFGRPTRSDLRFVVMAKALGADRPAAPR